MLLRILASSGAKGEPAPGLPDDEPIRCVLVADDEARTGQRLGQPDDGHVAIDDDGDPRDSAHGRPHWVTATTRKVYFQSCGRASSRYSNGYRLCGAIFTAPAGQNSSENAMLPSG